jgi:hypothetical protein
MMRRFLVAFLIVAFAAGSLDAQRRPRIINTGEPGVWLTGGVAGFTATGVNDGVTASSWDFGNSTNLQYRASLEKTVGTGGSSFGIAGSYARVPFVFRGELPTPDDAHLDLMTLLATFHAGSGYGFHQVIELNGGIVAYKNLKRDSDGATLAGGRGSIDPLFSIGYGIGYGFSDRTQLEFVPDYAIAIHERSGLSNGVSNTNSMRSLRVTLRMGFGGRTVRR